MSTGIIDLAEWPVDKVHTYIRAWYGGLRRDGEKIDVATVPSTYLVSLEAVKDSCQCNNAGLGT